MSESEQIVNLIAGQTKILLLNHWPDITDFRHGEESIKVGFSADIKYQGQKQIIETTISFGKRVKDSVINEIDSDQLKFGLEAGFGRRSKPKNILEKALTSEPAPESQPGTAA